MARFVRSPDAKSVALVSRHREVGPCGSNAPRVMCCDAGRNVISSYSHEAAVMKTSAFVYLGLAWLLLPGCGMLSDAERSPLAGPPWVLQAIVPSGENQIVVEDRSNYLIFQEDGSAEGRADCNTCQGDYTVEGDRLDVDFACTRIYCGAASMGNEFQRGLLQATTYQIRGDRLTIATEEGTLLLEAVR